MISIEQEANIEMDFIYRSLIDEAELYNLEGSSMQLFINANLRNILTDQIKLKMLAQRKVTRNNDPAVQELRDEEILYMAVKGKQQKEIKKKYGYSAAAIGKIIKRSIAKIYNLSDTNLTPTELLNFYLEDLKKYFFTKKLEAKYELRNSSCSN